jgi:hypothetical protein
VVVEGPFVNEAFLFWLCMYTISSFLPFAPLLYSAVGCILTAIHVSEREKESLHSLASGCGTPHGSALPTRASSIFNPEVPIAILPERRRLLLGSGEWGRAKTEPHPTSRGSSTKGSEFHIEASAEGPERCPPWMGTRVRGRERGCTSTEGRNLKRTCLLCRWVCLVGGNTPSAATPCVLSDCVCACVCVFVGG